MRAVIVGLVSALVTVALVACPNTQTTKTSTATDAHLADGAPASVGDVCSHLVSVGCGHDASACTVGLQGEVDGGLVFVDLACANIAPDAVTAAKCAGIGVCPP